MGTISVAKDFSVSPGPRFKKQGPNSGEAFREKVLLPALKRENQLTVILDGTQGYGSSWLDEAFGGLVREHGYNPNKLKNILQIISNEDPMYRDEVLDSVERARPQ
ncbi:MAG: STAS-like domain-containing protein [Roseibium sp.]|uniref:STAS-like domain-containing protein n=1 Tax=Roseibium polysiphoniae TaxID=2571221 RepID=UPI00329865C1